MSIKKIIFALPCVLLSLVYSSSSFAVADCLLPVIAAGDVLATSNLALWDPASGRPLWRVLREMQATRAINTENQKATQKAAFEGLRNGLIAYNQEAEQLELYRRAVTAFPDPTAMTCAQSTLNNGVNDAMVKKSQYIQSGMSLAESRSLTQKTSMQEVNAIKKDMTTDSVAYSAGVITRPGCQPVFDPAITIFETQTPIPIGWNCSKNEPSSTIDVKKYDQAQKTLSRLLHPNPYPLLDVAARKTPAGQAYESLAQKAEEGRSFIAYAAYGALSNYAPIIQASKLVDIYKHYKIDTQGLSDLSILGDIAKRNAMRFNNRVFLDELRGTMRKNILIAHHQSQLNRLRMIFLMYEQEHRLFYARMSTEGVIVADAAQTSQLKKETNNEQN